MTRTRSISLGAALALAHCWSAAFGQSLAPFESAYATLQGTWNLTNNLGYPYTIEIAARKLRVPIPNNCAWLPYTVLSDKVTANEEIHFRRIVIEIRNLPKFKEGCIHYPVFQFTWKLPADDVYGNGPTYALVDQYASLRDVGGHSASISNYSRQGP